MTFIKVRFPSGTFGISSQEPMTEKEAELLLAHLNAEKSECMRCKIELTPDLECFVQLKNNDSAVYQSLVFCPNCQNDAVAALNSVLTIATT